jgi:uncharacterized protein (DUF433 family)
MINLSAPDLTQHPPRSPRVRLGGYAHLPRLLDKARAQLFGKVGEYKYNCGLDRRFFDFTGITAAALLAEAQTGKSDAEILAWIGTQTKREGFEILAWSAWLEQRGPSDREDHENFAAELQRLGATRDDIRTYFDRLDLDDYLSFGGKP